MYWPWPNATYNLNGKELTYSEFWASGMAPIALLINIALCALSILTAFQIRISKYLVFLYWSCLIALITFSGPVGCIIGGCIILAWALYIFKSTAVTRYYQGGAA